MKMSCYFGIYIKHPKNYLKILLHTCMPISFSFFVFVYSFVSNVIFLRSDNLNHCLIILPSFFVVGF